MNERRIKLENQNDEKIRSLDIDEIKDLPQDVTKEYIVQTLVASKEYDFIKKLVKDNVRGITNKVVTSVVLADRFTKKDLENIDLVLPHNWFTLMYDGSPIGMDEFKLYYILKTCDNIPVNYTVIKNAMRMRDVRVIDELYKHKYQKQWAVVDDD